jgi:hypothetical protein
MNYNIHPGCLLRYQIPACYSSAWCFFLQGRGGGWGGIELFQLLYIRFVLHAVLFTANVESIIESGKTENDISVIQEQRISTFAIGYWKYVANTFNQQVKNM